MVAWVSLDSEEPLEKVVVWMRLDSEEPLEKVVVWVWLDSESPLDWTPPSRPLQEQDRLSLIVYAAITVCFVKIPLFSCTPHGT